MLVYRLEEHPNEEDILADTSWLLLKRSVAMEQLGPIRGAMSLRWTTLAKHYISKDPVGLAKTILDSLAVEDRVFTLDNYRGEILIEATEIAPTDIWQVVAKLLLQPDEFAYRLQLALEYVYVTYIDTDYLMQWAEQNLPEGPKLLSRLAPVGGSPLWSPARELLIRYGADRGIKENLLATYRSGSWVGPMSVWLESKLDIAKTWLQDPHIRVREWAGEVIQSLEYRIKDAKLREEEEKMYGS